MTSSWRSRESARSATRWPRGGTRRDGGLAAADARGRASRWLRRCGVQHRRPRDDGWRAPRGRTCRVTGDRPDRRQDCANVGPGGCRVDLSHAGDRGRRPGRAPARPHVRTVPGRRVPGRGLERGAVRWLCLTARREHRTDPRGGPASAWPGRRGRGRTGLDPWARGWRPDARGRLSVDRASTTTWPSSKRPGSTASRRPSAMSTEGPPRHP